MGLGCKAASKADLCVSEIDDKLGTNIRFFTASAIDPPISTWRPIETARSVRAKE